MNQSNLRHKAVPLHVLQNRMNGRYYAGLNPKNGLPEGRLGFATPSQDKRFCQTSAHEFVSFARKREGPLRVDEFGAADGTFAKHFMDNVRETAPDVNERLTYHSWDKSPALLEKGRATLSSHSNVRVGVADVLALKTDFAAGSSDYVYCHELFDDLATRVVARREDKLGEIWFIPIEIPGVPDAEAYRAEFFDLPPDVEYYADIKGFMDGQPEKMRVTFPVDGIKALYSTNALLKSDAVLRVTDYGYLNSEVIKHFVARSETAEGKGEIFSQGYSFTRALHESEDTQHMNLGIACDTQITTPVNFPFLRKFARRIGLKTKIEPQLVWASRIAEEAQVFPSHYTQGFAYCGGGPDTNNAVGVPNGVMKLMGAHPLLRTQTLIKISDIIRKLGETKEALQMVLENVIKGKMIFPKRIHISRSEVGQENFVMKALVRSLAKPMIEKGTYARIKQKARSDIVIDLMMVPESSQAGFRVSFSREISELESMGFDKKELGWALFCTPVDYKFSGSMFRVSFTATKK
ncbi:MAG: SAM-dependent methyltransferase [Candidatus Micrarchaeota archaeon]